MPECAICGSSDFGEPQDGLYFCMECGTQSQDARVEVSAAVEGGGFLRTLKRKSEITKKDSSQLVNNEHTLETFQRILKLQCDALISLGLDPSIKEAARLIWFTYLRHFGYAFRDQSPTGDSQTSTVSGDSRKRKQRRETLPSLSSPKPKRAKTEDGFDSFPSDHLLFTEEGKEERGTEPQAKKAAGSDSGSVPVVMEEPGSWEQLKALERSMDCWQLYKFRVSNKHGQFKPKVMPKDMYWGKGVQVFTRACTVSVLYLALLYTKQNVLPADLTRWITLEKVPYKNPVDDRYKLFRNKDNAQPVFSRYGFVCATTIVARAHVFYNTLPLPPLPTPNPHSICHLLIDRLKLTACFRDLVDKVVDRVYSPLIYGLVTRIDAACMCIIVITLRVLYGLDDHLEIEQSLHCWKAWQQIKEEQEEEEEEEEEVTTANSLYLWEDWVQLYCCHLGNTMREGIPLNSREFTRVENYQAYFEFCKDIVFTRSRPTPNKINFLLDPKFNCKVSEIIHRHNQRQEQGTDKHTPSPSTHPHPPTTPSPSTPTHPPTNPTPSPSTPTHPPTTPTLFPLSLFVEGVMVPCALYRPLPESHKTYRDNVALHLSHSMQFILSVSCDLIDIDLKDLYHHLLIAESSFLKGTFDCLRSIGEELLLKLK